MESRPSRMLEGLREREGLSDYGPTLSRVPSSTWKFLARGQPVTEEQVIAIAANASASLSEANEFLSRTPERDANGNIVGAMGLSLNKHVHTFIVGDTPMSTVARRRTLIPRESSAVVNFRILPGERANDTDFEERPVRWALGGSVAALALVAACCLVLLWSVFGLSAGEKTGERELTAVTFIVGGMMKSRSAAT